MVAPGTPPGPGGGCGADDCDAAQGALVGAIGPGAVLEAPSAGLAPGKLSLRAAAHGAAVGPIEGRRDSEPAVAHGALVPASTLGRAVLDDAPPSGTFGRAWGPDVAWTVVGGATALGSLSQLNRDPKGKCCTTGNLDKTSALYIFTIPYTTLALDRGKIWGTTRRFTLLILPHPVRIPEIS